MALGATGYASLAQSVLGFGAALTHDYYVDPGISQTEVDANKASMTKSVNSILLENKYTQNIYNEQLMEIDTQVGSMMSKRGLDALKTRGSIMAAGAVTGTQGGSTDARGYQAFMDQQLDNAIIMDDGKQSKTDLMRSNLMAKISYDNRIENAISTTVYEEPYSTSSSILGQAVTGAAGGLSSFSNILQDKGAQSAVNGLMGDNTDWQGENQ